MTLTPGKVVLSNPLTCTNTPKGENKLYSDAKGVVPSLDLRFAEGKTLNDYMTGQNLITFSRPVGANQSPGTYVDENGIIQLSSANTPRFDHNPATGESLGLLIEESRTNLFDYSTDLTQWTASNSAPPVASSEIAPDGSTDAYKLNINIGPGSYFTRNVPTVAGSVYTISVWAKNVPGEQNFFDLFFNTATPVQLGKTALTDTWTRYHITGTATQTGNVLAGINNPPDDYTARGLFWGFQFELGAFPTSYIPTTGTALTRSADTASITGTNFSDFYNQKEGTVFADITPVDVETIALFAYFNTASFFESHGIIKTNAASNGPGLYINADNYSGGSGTINLDSNNTGQRFKAAYSYKDSDFKASYEGGAVLTGVWRSPSPTNFWLGQRDAGVFASRTHISRFTYFPERLPDATLQAITA